ncbi:TPA: glycosyltransferase [Morganella morganii]|uniref:glycosyltransferase n=1 Tax=Morganella morganii TaxID=582 RepID=UPI001BD9AA4A|nr:glycosyltransferase [Morganella morganii]MBT0389330.1 glycosyltransferase [Morganella morganii subsp. morganii]HEJ1051808.1 glycosyltransferase [Morganella morganii]
MKLTVCVSTYNQSEYILECLKSIDEQECNINFDIIVGVDHSPDSTLSIVESYKKISRHDIIIITSDMNIGASENYLRIHKVANGDYVCHIDGDDIMLPGKIQKQVDILNTNNDISAVWHNMILFNDDGVILDRKYADIWKGIVNLTDFLRVGFIGAHSSIMYRKSCRRKYDFSYPVPDYAIFLELLSNGNGYVIEESLGKYRHNVKKGTINTSLMEFKNIVYKSIIDYDKKYQYNKKDLFCFSLLNLLADIKSGRKLSPDLISLFKKNISFLSLFTLYDSYKKMKKTNVNRR